MSGTYELPYWNILMPDGTPVGKVENDTGLPRRYYLTDHLGSVRTTVNESGQVLETRDYYPFGLEMPQRILTTGTKTREGYTGHELDEATGLNYAGAR